MPETSIRPADVSELAEAIREARRPLLARGGGTKPALSTAPGADVLDLRGLAGVVDYSPEEFTLAARAGTPLAEVEALLASHGQALAFDPPLATAGATLGGTLVSGLSGPGRQRFGGVRDFVLAVEYVDGRGRMLKAGAPVVKNAAGFDLPKLLVGSLGRLAVVSEATFKVFPRPEAYLTGHYRLADLDEAIGALVRLQALPFDLEGLELAPSATVSVRVAGPASSLSARLDRIAREIEGREERGDGEEEARFWRELRDFDWVAPESALMKIPLTPSSAAGWAERFAQVGASYRLSAGASLAWVALAPEQLPALDEALLDAGANGLLLRGGDSETPGGHNPIRGARNGEAFLGRIRGTLDPVNRFGE